jgi:chemotaxis signal transduction protein
MKNVLVFALGGERFAVELRWVREVATLAHLTPVPTAPALVAGIVNHKGAIVPVLHVPSLLAASGGPGTRATRAPRVGDSLVVLDVDEVRAAVAADRVDAVTTLASGASPATLIDAHGKTVPLIEPQQMFQVARQLLAHAAFTTGQRRE